jgi:hypothetical protein
MKSAFPQWAGVRAITFNLIIQSFQSERWSQKNKRGICLIRRHPTIAIGLMPMGFRAERGMLAEGSRISRISRMGITQILPSERHFEQEDTERTENGKRPSCFAAMSFGLNVCRDGTARLSAPDFCCDYHAG